MPKEINGFFNRIYENFFMRDLTYVFGGSILLATTYHTLKENLCLEQNLSCAIKYVTQNLYTFLILIAVSYFYSLIVQEGCLNLYKFLKFLLTKIFKTESKDPPYEPIEVFMALLSKKFGASDIRELERTIYLKNVGSAIGTSSLISTLIFLFRLIENYEKSDRIIFVVLVVITAVGFSEFIVKHYRQKRALEKFCELYE